MIMLDGGSGADAASYTPPSTDMSPGNDTPAVRKSTPKQEEEISVEDLPF